MIRILRVSEPIGGGANDLLSQLKQTSALRK